jgi:RNA polymerase sigma-70 factor (ECF subfamily)
MKPDDELKWMIAREIPHLRRYAALLTGSADGADDLVQDCLERALRKRHQWGRTGSLRSWLFRLLYTRHIDERRATRAFQRLLGPAPADTERTQLPNQEHSVGLADITAALQRLPGDQRAAILLVGVEGFSYEEAAFALDIPIGTLRSRVSRGRDALRDVWRPQSLTGGLRRVK